MNYPLKLSWKSELLPLLIVVAAWVLGGYFSAHFPGQVASHWNAAGQVNGYMSRTAGAFAIPGLLTVFYGLFLLLPMLDPKSQRYQDFQGPYLIFRNLILLTLLLIYLATGLYNLGYPVKIEVVTPVIIGLLFIVMGNYMGKLKKNWFVGIRTPWTLSSENVWNKTHRLGGFLFMLMGLLALLSPALPKQLGWMAFIIGVIVITIAVFAYSYWEFRKEQAQQPYQQD